MYSTERDHLWDRVHDAFYTRIGPDEKAYGTDRLEPLLWTRSKHLLRGKSKDSAVELLEELIRKKVDAVIDGAVKRAMLQRDLWLVFTRLALPPETFEGDPARKRLGTLLAKAIRRLALTPAQIAKLPDNYAAVASKKFAARFNPEKPGAAYL